MSNIHTSSLCLTQLTLFFSIMKAVSFRSVHFGSGQHVSGTHAQSAVSIGLPEVDLPRCCRSFSICVFLIESDQSNGLNYRRGPKLQAPNCKSEADSFHCCNPHIINREFTIIEVYKRQGSSPRLLFEPTLTGISSAVNGNHVLRGKVG